MRSTVLIATIASLVSHGALAQADADQLFRVFFDWDKPELTRDARTILDEAVASYGRLQPSRVEIAGHTDRSGPAAHNLRASRHRANAVKAYLADKGVPETAIAVAAFGESRPIVATEDGVREAQNRRVEIRLIPRN